MGLTRCRKKGQEDLIDKAEMHGAPKPVQEGGPLGPESSTRIYQDPAHLIRFSD